MANTIGIRTLARKKKNKQHLPMPKKEIYSEIIEHSRQDKHKNVP